jgi:hypothetical protein
MKWGVEVFWQGVIRSMVILVGILTLVLLFVPKADSQSVAHFGALSRGNPMHYARMCFCDNTNPVGIVAKDTWYRIKGFQPSGVSGWGYDPITGELTAIDDSVAGVYMFHWSVSMRPVPGLAAEYEAAIFKNGSPLTDCRLLDGFFSGLGAADNSSQDCIIEVTKDDVFSMDIKNISNANDIVVVIASASTHRM